ncbi:MAG: metal-dependent hydrolase [Saprospiraceae bacterium]|nr:metal-dependent hydrolase [Saprospiraceae bacterium]
MRLHYYGHSCFSVELKGKKLLFDPFISGNPLTQQVQLESIKADYILISHGHGDHMADAEVIAKNNNALIISTFEIVSWFESRGIKGIPMNTGGQTRLDFGNVKLVNAIHSSLLPDGSYGANPVGFCIHNEETSFYFAGDTALTMDMQLIPMTCPPLKFAILPIGDHFTMGYKDALIASDFIQCDQIVGCHFNTFPPIQIDAAQVRAAFHEKGKTITLPEINQAVNLHG